MLNAISFQKGIQRNMFQLFNQSNTIKFKVNFNNIIKFVWKIGHISAVY